MNPARDAPTPALAIRSAELSDVPAALNIAQQAPAASHWTAEQYRGLIAQGVVLVAERENKICGFIAAQIRAGDWEIGNVAVEKEYLRQGIASLLVGEIMKRARIGKASEVILEVRESNHAARSLYEKMGFRRQGIRPAYYRNPSEAAILYGARP
jgi:[ribosomal protein S18]-alanine N-acetyltransferase